MKKLLKSKLAIVILFDILTSVFFIIFNIWPKFTLSFYHKGLFPVFTLIMGKTSDLVPFSLTEAVITLLLILTISLSIRTALKIFQKRTTLKKASLQVVKYLFILSSLIICWFYWIWGFNYFCQPLNLKITVQKETNQWDKIFEEGLYYFIEQTNKTYKSINSKETDQPEIFKQTKEILFSFTKKKMNPAKRVKYLYSSLLDKTNTVGAISPFFLESHLANELIYSEIPFTLAHEKSHLFGVTSEAEANYIAFLVCYFSDNPFYQYSACFEVLIYFLNQYRRTHSKEEYQKVKKLILPEILAEYEQLNKRLKKNDTWLSRRFLDFYDWYLKTNKVSAGLKSYSQMVHLVINNEKIQKEIADYSESN
ncbi:MAG: DUF3810 domain-containing protein [Spirochaetes bacterium]|nr:DUF3810 domain-containing protein [Spirochaetota bacterium]